MKNDIFIELGKTHLATREKIRRKAEWVPPTHVVPAILLGSFG